MPRVQRLVAMDRGAVDPEKHEIHFTLKVSDAPPITLIARYGPAAQLVAHLAKMVSALNQILAGSNVMEATPAELVAATHIQRERWANVVLMQLTTPTGIPYTFALSPQTASDIADQLKTESAKPHQTGTA